MVSVEQMDVDDFGASDEAIASISDLRMNAMIVNDRRAKRGLELVDQARELTRSRRRFSSLGNAMDGFVEIHDIPLLMNEPHSAPPREYRTTTTKKRQAVEVVVTDQGEIDRSISHSIENGAVAPGYRIPGMPYIENID